MSQSNRLQLSWLLSTLLIGLSACGGGGGGGGNPQPDNQLPIAVAGPDQTVNEGVAVVLDGSGSSDPDGNIEFYEWTQTGSPRVTLTGSNTANPSFAAPTTTVALTLKFQLRVTDNSSAVATDSVQVFVNPVNEAPAISSIDDQSIVEDASAGPLAFTIGDSDNALDGLTVSAASDNGELVPPAGLVLSGSGANRSITVTPAANMSGTATITVTVSDGVDSASESFLLAVAPVNDAPVISDVTDRATDEDISTGAIAFTVSDADHSADALTVTASSSNAALVPSDGIALGGSGGSRTLTLTPAANQNGTAAITLTVSDGTSSATDSFTLTVNAVNDAPVADAGAFSGIEDTDITGKLTASDVDSRTLSYSQASGPSQGTVTVNPDGTFTYSSALNFNGADSFSFKVSDGAAESAAATVSITVEGKDEAVLRVSDAEPLDEDAGELAFEVTLSRAPDGPVTVAYTTRNGTAVGGRDYDDASGTLEFTKGGAISQIVTVPVRDDSADEIDETVELELRVTSGADSVQAQDLLALGKILDNDTSNLLLIGAAKRSVKPAQSHIDGEQETRLAGSERTQKFNLGGYGINPTQSLPDPANMAGEELTQPAGATVFNGSQDEEPIYLRVMVMEQAGGERVAFVTLDAIGAGNLIQDGVKAAIKLASCALEKCIEPENILFGQTHSHAGPDLQGLWGGVPEDWVQNTLYRKAADAVTEALESRRPARLMLAQGQTVEFNNYRRPRIDPNADADGTLTLLKAVGDDGTPVGSILQYNAHPTSITDKASPRIPHADYILGAMDWLENSDTGPGGVALYYNGPIADASPAGGRSGCDFSANNRGDGAGYGAVRCRGEGIADQALKYGERELLPTLTADERPVTLPITNPGFLAFGAIGSFNRYYNFLQQVPISEIPGIGPEAKNLPQLTPAATTLVSRITIGGADSGLEVVTIPGETTNTFGQYIRSLAKTNVMLLGLTHNSFGYILPEEEFSYVDQQGDDGLVAPFTGYEENVSLGPLTAPLLRTQAYNPLFAQAPEKDIPPTLSACLNAPDSSVCLITILNNRIDVLFTGLEICREQGLGAPGCPFRTTIGFFTDGLNSLAEGCRAFGGPAEFCDLFDQISEGLAGTGTGPSADDDLLLATVEAQLKGCDILDPSHCLFPFPSDHFTVAASAGSPQARNDDNPELGGTGKRINFNPLAMPRNAAGKPIDPTEWNRNDGYSPGQMIITYVPGLAVNADGTIPGAPTIRDARASLDTANSPVLVLDATEGAAEYGQPHPVWAEIDLNAGMLLYVPGREFGGDDSVVANPKAKQAALIIRPAVNFKEGHRYVVVLKDLPKAAGGKVRAGTAFTVCRDRGDDPGSALPPVQARCDQLDNLVFPVLANAGIGVEGNAALYLAWDFTVASTNNVIGRLRHMRDDAFVNYLGQQETEDGAIQDLGRAPGFEIVEINDYPAEHGQLVREVKGTFTVPSYVVPVDPSPADGQAELRRRINQLPPEIQGQIESGRLFAPIEASSPPNRLFYLPDETSAAACDPSQPEASLQGRCPEQARFGDGLPDRTGELTTTFTCRIARSTLSNKRFPGDEVPPQEAATADDVVPARPSLYGHGLLGDHGEINQDQLRRFGNDHNMMFCATDWFGFASGDLPNVVSMTLDVSNFPVLPDGTQQGILNQLFLARLMRHPQGFAGHDAFRVGGKPVFDTREVFYDGNSQGGITGGVVVAVSKDIKRGSLGVLGMNYSTLLTRSVDFDLFSVPLYASYPDDLDRDLVFSLMQMLWDRSENNGYAHHLRDNAALEGPDKKVLLHPAFGDHQVTMWSADVMARTVGAAVDRSRVSPERREPVGFNNPELGMQVLDYGPAQAGGSGLVYWDELWPDTVGDDCFKDEDPDGPGPQQPPLVSFSTSPPPVGNVPPRSGDDPHECPRRQAAARCQKSHFLHSAGRLIDVSAVGTDPANCPDEPEPVDTPPLAGEPPAAPDLFARIDDGLDELADACHGNAGPLSALCAISDALADFITDDDNGPVGDFANASCESGSELDGGRSYQIKIPSESGETISFQVLEPKTGINCTTASGAHPLIVHGHGFGGSRSTSGFDSYRNEGYAVISLDQRGFGDSSGTIRTLDPDVEGKDLIRILDWAEENLDYLAYRDEDEDSATHGMFVPRPSGGESEPSANLVAGSIGSSYGGGFQMLLHAVDEKNRLDALAPDITWHDLRYSLNPGDALKTAWSLLLVAGGEAGSFAPGSVDSATSQSNKFQGPRPNASGLDPYIREVLVRGAATGEFPREALEWFRYHSPTYWCGLNGQPTMPYEAIEHEPADPNTMVTGPAGPLGNMPGDNTREGQPKVDVLLTQGMRDALFNFNDAWWNYQCLKARGGDVRLITHQSGHILPDNANIPEQNKFQRAGGSRNCGTVNRDDATLQWFNNKLKGRAESAELAETGGGLCVSLADSDAVMVPDDKLLAPGGSSAYYAINGAGASSVPQGVLAESLFAAGANRTVVPLLQVTNADALIVAGIPQADITVTTPQGVNEAGCELGSVPTTRSGCDSVIFVGLGVKRAGTSTWILVDDQITPVRGLGAHANVSLVGVAERLKRNDELALLIYGYHPQYLASYSRDVTIPVVNVAANLKLPLYAVNTAGAPDFDGNPALAVSRAGTGGSGCTDPDATAIDPACFAQGSAANVVRQLCDYQWLPGVCEMFAHDDPGYQPGGAYDETADARDLQQFVGAVHEHSGYSDGDPTAIPRDYFNAAKTGHNTPDSGTGDTGVILDFMLSSEHSDNEKLPATTAAVCAQTFINGIEAGGASLGAEDPGPFVTWLSSQNQTTPATVVTDLLKCQQFVNPDHYFKWQATVEQARAATEQDEQGNYTGFTAVRGFEWTNDYYNHMNVYFSTNVVNVKVDGSYATMDRMWDWLRRPVAEGGGADALVTFNHPGGAPALTPFDDSQPHNELLAQRGDSNWNDLEYIPTVDERVAGIEVNGGDDIEWYVKALTNGWHLGPLANEDEHQREWSASSDGKTLILTRGRSPRDYYWALKNHRTVAIRHDLVDGVPGSKTIVPTIHFWADGADVQTGIPLGMVIHDATPTAHTLHVEIAGLQAGYRIALLGKAGGQGAPTQLGVADARGAFSTAHEVTGVAGAEDWRFVVICSVGTDVCGDNQNYSAVTAPIWIRTDAGAPPPTGEGADYGTGLLGALGSFMAELNNAITTLFAGDAADAADGLITATSNLVDGLLGLPTGGEDGPIAAVLGDDPAEYVARETAVNRNIEAVVLAGAQIPVWSVPAAQGAPYPYPSGAGITNQGSGAEDLEFLNQGRDLLMVGEVRSAHNGVMVYPQAGAGAPMGPDVTRIAAYKFENGTFTEIPVQVDQRYPYFLANAKSTFSVYSGTDEELSYEWDVEKWGNPGEDEGTENLASSCLADFTVYRRGGSKHTPDPVSGLDHDDEIVFMYQDAGEKAATADLPASDGDFDASQGLQEIALTDPLNPGMRKFVYLGLKKEGATAAYLAQQKYVRYKRDSRTDGDAYDADQWIDSSFFSGDDPEKLGIGNTNYGPNRSGTVCGDVAIPAGSSAPRRSTAEGYDPIGDRFPRDGVTVSTDTYRWYASGRWMVREVRITNPNNPSILGPDLIDRWKGRAFQQNPDSYINVIGGFEDEQVNWEANSTLIGERCGPVRCMREVWGADSGTNVTKTETFYRDAIASRYRVRVHPIPPDGLYTAWDYNRNAMIPTAAEKAAGIQGGRYFTALRPNGVPVDGKNDDIGQVDGVAPFIPGQCPDLGDKELDQPRDGRCPMYFDTADPSFNLPLAFNNWEQISGKGDSGSLVYVFEIKGPASLGNPLVVPYYRDDECFDDGTGDDPVARPFPGEAAYDIPGYLDRPCEQRQGAYASHGVHYFFTHDSDNAFVEGKPLTEIDGQWWQFMVPTAQPENRGAEHANVVRVPLQTVVTPRLGANADSDGDGVPDSSDNCPNEAGTPENSGCPDSSEPPAEMCAPDEVPLIGGECMPSPPG